MSKDIKQKLNYGMKDHILHQATEKLRKKKDKALDSLEQAMEKHMETYFSKEDQALIDSLPEGWLHSTTKISFKLPMKRDNYFCFHSKKDVKVDDGRWVELGKPKRYPCNHTISWGVPPTDRITKLYFKYHEELNNYHQTGAELWGRLKAFKSYNKLVEAWPEVKKYVKGYTPEMTTALAVRFDDINAKIK